MALDVALVRSARRTSGTERCWRSSARWKRWRQEIHIILDTYSTHKHARVMGWIERQGRIFLHFMPTSASWLNLVERFFSALTQKQIRRGVL